MRTLSRTNSIRSTMLIAMAALTLAACSKNSAPGADEVRKVILGENGNIKTWIDKGVIRLKDVRKNNGQAGESQGIKFYTVTYEADIEFLKDLEGKEIFDSLYFGYKNCRMWYEPTKAGEVRSVTCELTFELTENGWRGPDGNIY